MNFCGNINNTGDMIRGASGECGYCSARVIVSPCVGSKKPV
jgi:hypothetical protein